MKLTNQSQRLPSPSQTGRRRRSDFRQKLNPSAESQNFIILRKTASRYNTMKYQLLLLCLLAAFSNNVAAQVENKLNVAETADGIKLTCKDTFISGMGLNGTELLLAYRDSNTGVYSCGKEPPAEKIYVKFRTCDNCVELDTSSIVGLAVGDVVATIVVGVAVYLIASQGRPGQVKSTKKKSDKQNLIRNEAPNDPSYQPLKYKRGRDEYDVLNRK